jgi:hypothetical protein
MVLELSILKNRAKTRIFGRKGKIFFTYTKHYAFFQLKIALFIDYWADIPIFAFRIGTAETLRRAFGNMLST